MNMMARRFTLALLATLLVTRLAGLGVRQPHHDEAVHGVLSERLRHGAYVADPVFHGPLLYHLEGAVFAGLGRGLWQARLVPALAGIASLVLLVAIVRREVGERAAVVLGVLVTASPILIYYGRFNAHDTLILLVTVGLAWGRAGLDAGDRRAVFLVATLVALGWSTKLNVLFPLGALLTFPLVRRCAGAPVPSRPARRDVLAALVIGVAIVAGLHVTTFASHLASQPPADALLTTMRAALVDGPSHWARMHDQQRLPGPFHYYGLLLLIYEPLVVVASVAALWAWARGARGLAARRLAWCLAVGGVLGAMAWASGGLVARVLHLTPAHVVVVPLGLMLAWWTIVGCVRRGETSRAWWLWLATSQSLLYAVAGEKVPWLAVHVLLPWTVVAAWTVSDWLAEAATPRVTRWRVALVAVGVAYMAWGAVAVTTFNRSNVGEPLVQVEYGPEFHALLARAPAVCAATDRRPCLVLGVAAWDFVEWYLGPQFRAVSLDLADRRADTPIVIAAPSAAGAPTSADARHVTRSVMFLQWGTWVEAIERGRVAEVAAFFVHRERLGVRRANRCDVQVRADLAAAVWGKQPEQ